MTRIRAKLTQTQLAEKAHTTQDAISRIETKQTREPSFRLVMRICRALLKPCPTCGVVDATRIDEFADGGKK